MAPKRRKTTHLKHPCSCSRWMEAILFEKYVDAPNSSQFISNFLELLISEFMDSMRNVMDKITANEIVFENISARLICDALDQIIFLRSLSFKEFRYIIDKRNEFAKLPRNQPQRVEDKEDIEAENRIPSCSGAISTSNLVISADDLPIACQSDVVTSETIYNHEISISNEQRRHLFMKFVKSSDLQEEFLCSLSPEEKNILKEEASGFCQDFFQESVLRKRNAELIEKLTESEEALADAKKTGSVIQKKIDSLKEKNAEYIEKLDLLETSGVEKTALSLLKAALDQLNAFEKQNWEYKKLTDEIENQRKRVSELEHSSKEMEISKRAILEAEKYRAYNKDIQKQLEITTKNFVSLEKECARLKKEVELNERNRTLINNLRNTISSQRSQLSDYEQEIKKLANDVETAKNELERSKTVKLNEYEERLLEFGELRDLVEAQQEEIAERKTLERQLEHECEHLREEISKKKSFEVNVDNSLRIELRRTQQERNNLSSDLKIVSDSASTLINGLQNDLNKFRKIMGSTMSFEGHLDLPMSPMESFSMETLLEKVMQSAGIEVDPSDFHSKDVKGDRRALYERKPKNHPEDAAIHQVPSSQSQQSDMSESSTDLTPPFAIPVISHYPVHQMQYHSPYPLRPPIYQFYPHY